MSGEAFSLGGVVRSLLFIGVFISVVVLLLYGLYVFYFYAGQRSMMFPLHLIGPPPASFLAHNATDLSIQTHAGRVEAWLLWPHDGEAALLNSRPPYPLVIIGHGNGEIIDYWVEAVEPLRSRGMAVLLVEYPGYGRSAGVPTQDSIVEVFVAAYDAAVAHEQIDEGRVVFFGRSVGGGAVAQLAVQRPSAGLVLFSTFSSVRAMAASYRLPGFLARDPFDTQAVVAAYSRPILLLHGTQDPIIPFVHAQRLQAAAPHAELRPLPCGHNDCVRDWDSFWASLDDFWPKAWGQME
jgi:fermentation-respiration switch protein FrsA (DUF1100 family)